MVSFTRRFASALMAEVRLPSRRWGGGRVACCARGLFAASTAGASWNGLAACLREKKKEEGVSWVEDPKRKATGLRQDGRISSGSDSFIC